MQFLGESSGIIASATHTPYGIFFGFSRQENDYVAALRPFDADGHPENVYCRSDHFNWARYSVPVTFFTTGLHGDYHQVTDEPQYIDYDGLARVSQLVYNTATRIANLKHRLVVDKAKPDPNGNCVQ